MRFRVRLATFVLAFVTVFTAFSSDVQSYVCGDADGSGAVNIADVTYLIARIFAGGPPPVPPEGGDANCDGGVNIADVTYLIARIFAGGPAPCCPTQTVIHISPTGNDGSGDGTTAFPYLTISHALAVAAVNPNIQEIRVASGSYPVSVDVIIDFEIKVTGGFNPVSWVQSGTPSSVFLLSAGSEPRFVIDGVTDPVTIENLRIEAADETTVGKNSNAVLVRASTQVAFTNCEIVAGDVFWVGAIGTPGVNGTIGPSGVTGQNGQSNGSGGGGGGIGGVAGSRSGGNGGNGGYNTGSGSVGGTGSSGAGGPGGSGGSGSPGCFNPGGTGGPGGVGPAGADGAPAMFATPYGSLVGTHFIVTQGNIGSTGADGRGGGGGGGGGGGFGSIICNPDRGGGGGGGGAGGEGAGPGGGGAGGGNSIAVLSVNSSVTLTNSKLITGNAGNGANGGPGGIGGDGGPGASGGSGADESGGGGIGGTGGRGGDGGNGGGGHGGSSIGLLRLLGGVFVDGGGNIYTIGSAGFPGNGGNSGFAVPAPAGSFGLSAGVAAM